MLMTPSYPYRNSLLRKMDPLDLSLIEPFLELCALPQRMAIEGSGISHRRRSWRLVSFRSWPSTLAGMRKSASSGGKA